MLAHCRVCFSLRKLHYQASHRNANPTQELAFIRSFRFIRSFHYRHFCFSTLQIHVLTAWLHYIQLSLSTPHKNALPFIHSFQLHSLTTVSPCHFQRTVRAKKCAKLAAGSTQPPRFALSVSGAFAPLAAARPQRTGWILRSVSLHSLFSLAIHTRSRLFYLLKKIHAHLIHKDKINENIVFR